MKQFETAPTPSTEDAIKFLQKWRPEGPWVLAAIRPDGGNIETISFELLQLNEMRDWIDRKQGLLNIYFTVNPVINMMNKKPRKSDMRGLAAIHVDVDPHPIDGGRGTPDQLAEHNKSERKRILKELQAFKPAPTVIIDSGGGFQGFWVLDEEQRTDGSEERAMELEAYNLQVEVMLQADSCHNIDRIMRLPGTVNIPGERKRKKGRVEALAKVVDADWGRVYSLGDFTPAQRVVSGGKIDSETSASNLIALDALPSLNSLDELPASVSAGIKALIVNGSDPDNPERYPSRSEAVFAVLCALVRADCSDGIMASIILDPDFAISAHVLDQPQPLKYAERQITRARKEATEPELSAMNIKHAVVKYGGKVRYLVENGNEMPSFLARSDFENWYSNKRITIGQDDNGKSKEMNLAKWWIEHPSRRSFESVEFLPGTEAPEDTYNLWRGPAITPVEGDCDLYLELVQDVVAAGNAEVADYIFNWMALKLQQPELKLETSLALRGGQGIGKSRFAELYGELFGPYFITVSDQKGLTGQFNAHLQRALLVFADEIAAPSNVNSIGRLKTLVTQSRIQIEPKGLDSFSAPNYFSLILASNNAHIIATDADDRRWIVLDVSPQKRGDRVFFNALNQQWKKGGREAFAHFLMSRDLSHFEHRDKPHTTALIEQIEASFTGAPRIIHEMLVTGETPEIWVDGKCLQVPIDRDQVFIPSGSLADWAVKKGFTNSANPMGLRKSLGRFLSRLSVNDKATRFPIGRKNLRGTWLPKLQVARQRWCEIHQRQFDWGEDENADWEVVDKGSKTQRNNDEPPF